MHFPQFMFRRVSGAILAFLLTGFFCVQLKAQAPVPTEYEVKAAFLFNFAKFVEWSPQKTGVAGSPIVLVIFGEDPFGDDLERTIQSKTINGHPFQVKRVRQAEKPPENAHVVFICSSERRRVDKILESLRGTGSLTVSETDQFCEKGGMINFRMEASKVRFEINHHAAQREGLKLSSKLLSVAARVHSP
jgi:hypothetical protein